MIWFNYTHWYAILRSTHRRRYYKWYSICSATAQSDDVKMVRGRASDWCTIVHAYDTHTHTYESFNSVKWSAFSFIFYPHDQNSRNLLMAIVLYALTLLRGEQQQQWWQQQKKIIWIHSMKGHNERDTRTSHTPNHRKTEKKKYVTVGRKIVCFEFSRG